MTYFSIVNWKRFQHYKERNPPWIKLHRELLVSRAWISADDATRSLMIALMLIAADTDNKIPADSEYVRRRAYLNSEPDFSRLVEAGFIEQAESASDVLATCKQDARPEAEAEADPPLKNLSIQSKAKAFRAISSVENRYSQADFDARDLRRLAEARKEVELEVSSGQLSGWTDAELWERQCAKAGLSCQQAEDVITRSKKQPQPQMLVTSA